MEPSTPTGEPANYLAVCAMYRWAADYLREWVAFHRVVGVERFFLYDNSTGDEDAAGAEHRKALKPFIDDGTVVVHPWPVYPGMHSAYDHCLENHREDARWIAFIDCDEFLFSPTRQTLPEVLREFEGAPGIGVNFAWMGTSFHRSRPEGLVIENFVHRLDLPNPTSLVMSIVNPRQAERCRDAHSFIYRDGGQAVDETGEPFDGWIAPANSFERLRINHYFTKSEEEALLKFSRPQAKTGKQRQRWLNIDAVRKRNERFAVPDTAIQEYLPAVREGLARIERGEPFEA